MGKVFVGRKGKDKSSNDILFSNLNFLEVLQSLITRRMLQRASAPPYLNKGIGLYTLCIFHGNFESIFGSKTRGVFFEMNGFQDGGEIPNVVEAGH